MATPEQFVRTRSRPITHLRWWIGGMLFASTVSNYIDRQTLALLAPYLLLQYHWSNTDYANLVVAFRVAYSIGLTLCGRLMDGIGTRRGLTLSVAFYSAVAMLTSLARGVLQFCDFSVPVGRGGVSQLAGCYQGCFGVVSSTGALASSTAFFDSGSSVGGAIAPFLVLWIYFRWGWRPAFMVPGVVGFSWLLGWRWIYHSPNTHPRISEAERHMLTADQGEFGRARSSGRAGATC